MANIEGRWVTMNGAKVFISDKGDVIMGLGKNKDVDDEKFTSDFTQKQKKKIADVIKKTNELHPGIKDNVKEIVAEKLIDGDEEVLAKFDDGRIVVKQAALDDFASETKDVEDGWYAVNSMEGVIAHEIGHSVEPANIDTILNVAIERYYGKYDITTAKQDKARFMQEISLYAATDRFEAFSEAFSSASLRPGKNKAADTLISVWREMFDG